MTDPASGLLPRHAFLAASFLSLFLEILLIRWCGAEIRILAYVSNLTLLGCFLGLGLGYAACNRRRLGLGWTFGAVLLLVALSHPQLSRWGLPNFRALSELLNFSDMNAWLSADRGAFGFVFGFLLLGFLYFLFTFACLPIGQLLGAHFRDVPADRRVREYTWNVFASILGIAAFGVLSFVEVSPALWMLVAGAAALTCAREKRERVLVVAATVVVMILFSVGGGSTPLEGDVALRGVKKTQEVVETRWSPYQKIQLVKETYSFPRPLGATDGPAQLDWVDHSAYVNGHWYSRVGTSDLVVSRQRADYANASELYTTQNVLRIPYRLATGRGRVLLLGAGMGRDAATALDEGMAGVDCVEIEKRFVVWGRDLSPEDPYDDPRVDVHVDDARRFLRTSPPAQYDLVVFCYLDSHSLTSSFTNTNLDSFVYTRQSIAEAKRTLKPNGVLALGFWSPRGFIYKRIEALLEAEFGHAPLRVSGSLFVTGLESLETLRARAEAAPLVAANLSEPARQAGDAAPLITDDDWPYFYLETRSVPLAFLAVLLAAGIVSLLGTRLTMGKLASIDLHFFFLGAAFMLIETWTISRASLIYGATWYVSSAVITSLLIAVLCANAWVERRGTVRLKVAFPLLLGTVLGVTLIDPSAFLDMPRAAQLVLAAPFYAVPFLFASAIFASSFQNTDGADHSLASNLLGAVLGGGLECLSLTTGLRSLGFVALALYALAWLTAGRRSPS
jgi:spermidine synthase